MGRSRPIQHNLNINNPRLSFELSTLAYFRYLIKVFTLLVSVFAPGTNKLSIMSRCQAWHRQHSPMVTNVTDVAGVRGLIGHCRHVTNVNPSINVSVFCKGQDYNLSSVLRPSTP